MQDKVGAKIAALCHSEAAMVTAGCWSALVLGTGRSTYRNGCKESWHNYQIWKVSDKNEVIVQKGTIIGYIHALSKYWNQSL
ncbi:MAG: hypothetical protein WKG06_31910 [Segetibacter sp.]